MGVVRAVAGAVFIPQSLGEGKGESLSALEWNFQVHSEEPPFFGQGPCP